MFFKNPPRSFLQENIFSMIFVTKSEAISDMVKTIIPQGIEPKNFHEKMEIDEMKIMLKAHEDGLTVLNV
ncbi:hypothetical protein AYI69_g2218 [Smittium culicis]|uniref:Uncharacterized protein n=1 Tax=Smittium culicis TaxID=133412 RepID=A0A1R1YN29_9FUNG|nr:hypothetical protein AYI69_g2218 [Smittium culicis]